MKRIGWLALALAGALALGGCSALLERSYSSVEPYADKYWDSGAEDTLRADNYQDLVNTLLLIIEQRSETGAIRCYGGLSYIQALDARVEVRQETMLGSYLLEDMRFEYEENAAGGYFTLSYQITYREDAADMDSVMTLSDSQSLVDLLRLAVREGHDRLTARFAYHMSRENVAAAVESLWQEICENGDGTGLPGADQSGVSSNPEAPEEGDAPDGEAPPPDYPPCPWVVKFYPDMESADLVEIWLESD